jgi:hypothetical protein
LHSFKPKITKVNSNWSQERKSLSAEINWGVRFQSDPEVAQFIRDLAQEVCGALVNQGSAGFISGSLWA